MNSNDNSNTVLSLIGNTELDGFRMKTDQLMSDLDNDDISSALERINEINEINGKSFYQVIGKLTRGLHDAISELSISSAQEQPENDKTRVDLNYVIRVTDDAAKKTLDMTELSRANIGQLIENNDAQSKLLSDYSSESTTGKDEVLSSISSYCEKNNNTISHLNSNISEIVVAQNYQDIASQSITKAINIIQEVENSLVSLTQYANLLSKLSQFPGNIGNGQELENKEELKSDIGQFKDAEHLDQADVDNLLSSLGF